jgi:hypothetical protein
MTSRRMSHAVVLMVALTLIHILLALSLWARRPEAAEGSAGALAPLRTRALELVDDRGVVRSRLDVETSGEVVFRLMDPNGTIRVKLGAGEDGSGLLLLDETTEPAVHLIARRTATKERPNTTRITVNSAAGQRTVTP